MDDNKLVITMFGNFELAFYGESLFSSNQRKKKMVDLLQFFIINKNREFLPEKISEMLWPDREYSDVKNVIRTYVFRLRKFLDGENRLKKDFSKFINIKNLNGKYKAVFSEQCQVDVWEFDTLNRICEKENDSLYKKERIKEMLALYRGEFLADQIYQTWIQYHKSQYMGIYCKWTDIYMGLLWSEKKYDMIIAECEKSFSININETDDAINVFYLKALVEKKQYTQALNHYKYITSKMYQELAIAPSEELKKMYILIKSRQNNKDNEIEIAQPLEVRNDEYLLDSVYTFMEAYQTTRIKNITICMIRMLKAGKRAAREPYELKDKHLLYEKIDTAIRKVIRKEDTFIIFEDNVITLLLSEAKEEFYSTILKRLENSFFEVFDKNDLKLKMEICPVIKRQLSLLSPLHKSVSNI